MAVDQRNAGAAQTLAAGAAAYTVDRWAAEAVGAAATGERVAGAAGAAQYRYKFTGAAGVTDLYFYQRVEAANSYDLAGGTVSISADLADSLLTTVTWGLYYATATDNFASVTAIAAGTWTINSTVTRYSAQVAVPAAAVTGLQLTLHVGAQTSGTWTVGNVQLEPGSTATNFEFQDIGLVLSLCFRYFNSLNPTGATYFLYGVGFVGQVTNAYAYIPFPEMRVTPSILLTSVGTFIFNAVSNGIYAISAIIASSLNANSVVLQATISGGILGVGGFLQQNNTTISNITLSAEL
jgi:hypothetical protein